MKNYLIIFFLMLFSVLTAESQDSLLVDNSNLMVTVKGFGIERTRQLTEFGIAMNTMTNKYDISCDSYLMWSGDLANLRFKNATTLAQKMAYLKSLVIMTKSSISTNIGNADAGTGRVVIASNQTPISIKIPIPVQITDIASSVIVSNATTSQITPTSGVSYQIAIPITAVTGTLASLKIEVQESLDGGTNWNTVHTTPTFNTIGFYESPKLNLKGTKIRYIQTVGGTSPSFTRSIVRVEQSDTKESYSALTSKMNTTSTDVSIPPFFRSGHLEWTNVGIGIVTINGGVGSNILTALSSSRSWQPVCNSLYGGYSVFLQGGATIQWSFNY